MPISISQLTQEERTIVVPIGDETLNATYCPGKMTPEVEDLLRTAVEGGRPGGGLARALNRTLVRWDLTDENGTVMGTELELLKTLPTQFLTDVANAITRDMRPGASDRKNSGGGSLQAGTRGSSLTGTR